MAAVLSNAHATAKQKGKCSISPEAMRDQSALLQ
jgi:hypothetical protein